MYRLCVAVFTCCALWEMCSAAPRSWTEDARSDHDHQTDPLQQVQVQESILSQLLGDYEKVKALSEGSDCRCKCVVRPLSRSACRRIEEGQARAEDFYTVETITSGPECKCACIAPPSAVNPCEGEFRLKKLREAEKENVKLSTILELLEGSFYGMDLLKLHSVTNKLLERIDHIEKVVLVNQSTAEKVKPQQGPQLQADETESPSSQPLSKWHEEKMSRDEVSRSDIGFKLEKDKMKEEKNRSVHRSESSAEIIEMSSRETHKDSVSQVTKTGPNGLIIRGMTFYKSEPDPMVADDGEPGENLFEYDGFSGDGPINLFIEENLLQHKTPRPRTRPGQRTFRSKSEHPFSRPWKTTTKSKDTLQESPTHTAAPPNGSTHEPRATTKMHSQKDTAKPRQGPTDLTDEPHGAGTTMGHNHPPGKMVTKDSTKAFIKSSTPPTVMETSDPELKNQAAWSTTANPGTLRPTTTTASYTTPKSRAALSTQASKNEIPKPFSTQTLTPLTSDHTVLPLSTPGSTTASATATVRSTLFTSGAAKDVPKRKVTKGRKDAAGREGRHKRKPGDCKDTLATISEPVTHNTYGRNEGAWMKDPKSDNDKVYVTNYFYGNNLLEFTNLDVFKQGHFTNSYKLPYNWIGTGHVVYGGAFYYNRAFSRDIIKFDLHHRYVAAWTMLHDAIFEESSSPWEWRSYSDINFAVDESGLWIIYPALDDEGFLQEVVVLSRLNPVDLSLDRETTWRTGLRRNQYGNCFIVCGVLYFVDSYSRKEANLEYAFDTHTNTQMIPRMPFINNYTYTTQLDYNPTEGVLYAWDNGHQVTYNIKFAYVEP